MQSSMLHSRSMEKQRMQRLTQLRAEQLPVRGTGGEGHLHDKRRRRHKRRKEDP